MPHGESGQSLDFLHSPRSHPISFRPASNPAFQPTATRHTGWADRTLCAPTNACRCRLSSEIVTRHRTSCATLPLSHLYGSLRFYRYFCRRKAACRLSRGRWRKVFFLTAAIKFLHTFQNQTKITFILGIVPIVLVFVSVQLHLRDGRPSLR